MHNRSKVGLPMRSVTFWLRVDVQRLSAFESRYLRGNDKIVWKNFFGNSEVWHAALISRVQ